MGKGLVVVQECCSRGFECWVCTRVLTFSRVKIPYNIKAGFGPEKLMSFNRDSLVGRGLVLFSSHSAHNSNLSGSGRCWNFLKFLDVWYFWCFLQSYSENKTKKNLRFRIFLLFSVDIKVTLVRSMISNLICISHVLFSLPFVQIVSSILPDLHLLKGFSTITTVSLCHALLLFFLLFQKWWILLLTYLWRNFLHFTV